MNDAEENEIREQLSQDVKDRSELTATVATLSRQLDELQEKLNSAHAENNECWRELGVKTLALQSEKDEHSKRIGLHTATIVERDTARAECAEMRGLLEETRHFGILRTDAHRDWLARRDRALGLLEAPK